MLVGFHCLVIADAIQLLHRLLCERISKRVSSAPYCRKERVLYGLFNYRYAMSCDMSNDTYAPWYFAVTCLSRLSVVGFRLVLASAVSFEIPRFYG